MLIHGLQDKAALHGTARAADLILFVPAGRARRQPWRGTAGVGPSVAQERVAVVLVALRRGGGPQAELRAVQLREEGVARIVALDLGEVHHSALRRLQRLLVHLQLPAARHSITHVLRRMCPRSG